MEIKIYYEDTDAGGVVYYANYFKYFERGRTELLRELGVDLAELRRGGAQFVVRTAAAEYLSPALYGDTLTLKTTVTDLTGATVTFEHGLWRKGEEKPLATGTVTLASVNDAGRPTALPEKMKKVL